MKKYLIILLFLILSNNSIAQNQNASINWISFAQLSDSLQSHPKKVLLFFHTDWCVYCKKMMRETFRDPSIVKKINQDYYAIHFDAESTEEVKFDNLIFQNTSKKKKRGHYHQIVNIFFSNNHESFPRTIILDKDFALKKTINNYLSIKELDKIL